jgi:hypothetical protein
MAGLFIRVLDEHGVIFLLTPTGLLMEAHSVSCGYGYADERAPAGAQRNAVSSAPAGLCQLVPRIPMARAMG